MLTMRLERRLAALETAMVDEQIREEALRLADGDRRAGAHYEAEIRKWMAELTRRFGGRVPTRIDLVTWYLERGLTQEQAEQRVDEVIRRAHRD